MYCHNCGKSVPEDALFCFECGTKIKKEDIKDNILSDNNAQNDEREDITKESTLNRKGNLKKTIKVIFNIVVGLICAFGLFIAGCGFISESYLAASLLALSMATLLVSKLVLKSKKKIIVGVIVALITFAGFIGALLLEEIKSNDIKWSNLKLGEELPTPNKANGYVLTDSENKLNVVLHYISIKEFKEYMEKSKESGYTIEAIQEMDRYYAYDEEGDKLALFYQPSEKALEIELKRQPYDVEFNISCIQDKSNCNYNIDVFIDYEYIDSFSMGENNTIECELATGEHRIDFVSEDDLEIIDGNVFNITEEAHFEYKVYCKPKSINLELSTSE